MTISTEDLRKLQDKAASVFEAMGSDLAQIATELIAARAKIEAAEKLAEAMAVAVTHSDRHVSPAGRTDGAQAVYDGCAVALAAWEAAQ